MKIDGKVIAAQVEAEIRSLRDKCPGIPMLGLFAINPTKETEQFMRIKKQKAKDLGIIVLETMLYNPSQEEAEASLRQLVARADGVVVQQPVPKEISNDALLKHIPKEKDIDALTKESVYISPVARAVRTMLSSCAEEVFEKKVVVLGSGALVGKPVASLLKEQGAIVTIFDKETGVDHAVLQEADVVISGMGVPHMVTSDMVSKHAFIIDAGTSESGGTLRGDVDPRVYEYARLVSPVPGGLGPITVVELFKNLMISASCSS